MEGKTGQLVKTERGIKLDEKVEEKIEKESLVTVWVRKEPRESCLMRKNCLLVLPEPEKDNGGTAHVCAALFLAGQGR